MLRWADGRAVMGADVATAEGIKANSSSATRGMAHGAPSCQTGSGWACLCAAMGGCITMGATRAITLPGVSAMASRRAVMGADVAAAEVHKDKHLTWVRGMTHGAPHCQTAGRGARVAGATSSWRATRGGVGVLGGPGDGEGG